MPSASATAQRIVRNIKASGLSIYDPIVIGDPNLWLAAPELEGVLNDELKGLDLAGLPLRTRSKVIKAHVCEALGYPVPPSFQKTQPRFLGQCFDTYGQKANNLQIWNEEISPVRRYVLLGIGEDDVVKRVRVVSGDTLAKLDTTGTLTQKYQARFEPPPSSAELVSHEDTKPLRAVLSGAAPHAFHEKPNALPEAATLLSVKEVFARLAPLIGKSISAVGSDQERNRGAELHRLVVAALGYSSYADGGDFPDVRHQLLEVKLQTSPTIDLGLVRPDSSELLDIQQVGGKQIRHCDVRYAVFYGTSDGVKVILTHVVVSTGESFFSRFTAFGGNVLNKKLQIRLPAGFLD
jgi:hypothetical protein